MKTFREIYNQAYEISILRRYGFMGPIRGADGHFSFIKNDGARGAHPEVLIDLPGNELHYMLGGVVRAVGKIDNNSLTDFLKGKPSAKIETEETNSDRLAKQKIYEPDGGTYSSSENTSSSDGTHN
jgi:hypothetical protein